MFDPEKALLNSDWCSLGWWLFDTFLMVDRDSDDYQLAETIYLSLSRKERSLIEEV